MRILFSTWPAHGHLLPLLPLARAAERAGHSVVIASGAEGVLEASRRGLSTWEVGPSRAASDAAFRADGPDLGSLPPDGRMAAAISGMFGAAAFGRAADLVPRAEVWKPDLVVHSITELAGAVAAARVGARHVVHGLGPLPPESWTWFGARFGDLCASWGVPDLVEHILDVPYLDTCPPSLQSDAVEDFRNRRPLRPSSGEVLPGDRLPWDADVLASLPLDRTVHLTLGTLFHGATNVFLDALAGMRELHVNVAVTVGPGSDVDRLGPQPPNVVVADFAPHALLLPHCAALVTQGGAGTILAALCHGLPHLILPQGADQFRNAETAERAGVALVLEPSEATPGAIARAMARLLDESTFADACGVAQSQIDSMPDADAVLAELLDTAVPAIRPVRRTVDRAGSAPGPSHRRRRPAAHAG